MIRYVGSMVLVALLGACGGSSLPPSKMADTQAAISAADAVGAKDNPQAALHMKMARDQLKQAETLNAEDRGEEAGLVVERAQADAELALMLTRQAQASAALEKARAEVDSLGNKNTP